MIFEVVRGERGSRAKKWPKMTKNYVSHTPYLRKHTSCDCDFWYAFVKKVTASPDAFFIFSKF